MRASLLGVIVLVLALTAIVRPKWGLYSYIWFALMRPDVLAYDEGTIPYSLFIAAGTIIGAVPHFNDIVRLFKNPITLWLLALHVPVTLSAIFAVNPDLSLDALNLHLKMVATALLIPVLITTAEELRVLLVVMALSIGVLGIKFGGFALLQGGARYTVGYGGMMSDNNNMALAFCMCLPIVWYARLLVENKWVKILLFCMTFTMMVAIVMTHSRGGAIAMGAVILGIVFYSKRKLTALVVLGAVVAGSIAMVADSYLDRMETLQDPNQERSAESRILFWQAAVRIWLDYPVLGVGFGAENARALQQKYLPPPKTARDARPPSYIHNTYLEYLTGCGIFGFVLYVGVLLGSILWLGSAARADGQLFEDGHVVPATLQISLIAFAVGSVFLSRQSFDLVFILFAIAASYWLIRKDHFRAMAEAERDGLLPVPQLAMAAGTR